jgi:hypothetical protein
MVAFHDAMKISYIPFPFPYAQTCDVLLVLQALAVPFVFSQWVSEPAWAFIFSFIQVFIHWCLNFIAIELENPFGADDNDIDGRHMQEEMNEHLMLLLRPSTRATPQLTSVVRDLESPFASTEEGFKENTSITFRQVWSRVGGHKHLSIARRSCFSARRFLVDLNHIDSDFEYEIAGMSTTTDMGSAIMQSTPLSGVVGKKSIGAIASQHTVAFTDQGPTQSEGEDPGRHSFIPRAPAEDSTPSRGASPRGDLRAHAHDSSPEDAITARSAGEEAEILNSMEPHVNMPRAVQMAAPHDRQLSRTIPEEYQEEESNRHCEKLGEEVSVEPRSNTLSTSASQQDIVNLPGARKKDAATTLTPLPEKQFHEDSRHSCELPDLFSGARQKENATTLRPVPEKQFHEDSRHSCELPDLFSRLDFDGTRICSVSRLSHLKATTKDKGLRALPHGKSQAHTSQRCADRECWPDGR